MLPHASSPLPSLSLHILFLLSEPKGEPSQAAASSGFSSCQSPVECLSSLLPWVKAQPQRPPADPSWHSLLFCCGPSPHHELPNFVNNDNEEPESSPKEAGNGKRQHTGAQNQLLVAQRTRPKGVLQAGLVDYGYGAAKLQDLNESLEPLAKAPTMKKFSQLLGMP